MRVCMKPDRPGAFAAIWKCGYLLLFGCLTAPRCCPPAAAQSGPMLAPPSSQALPEPVTQEDALNHMSILPPPATDTGAGPSTSKGETQQFPPAFVPGGVVPPVGKETSSPQGTTFPMPPPSQRAQPRLPDGSQPELQLSTRPSDVVDRYPTRDETQRVAGSRMSPTPAASGAPHPVPTDAAAYPVWWRRYVSQPMRQAAAPRQITLPAIVAAALQHSAQVRVLTENPLIRDTNIVEADAEFDWIGFMEARWNDIDEPVGNELETGGPPRFMDEAFDYEFGARRKITTGGEFEIGQAYGTEASNSVFFLPKNQGTSQLTLSFTQPLLRVLAVSTTQVLFCWLRLMQVLPATNSRGTCSLICST